MNTPQSAMMIDHARAGIWLTADILDKHGFQAACQQAWQAYERCCADYPDDKLGLAIGFGADFWQSLPHASEAGELKSFPSYGTGEHIAPATQHDLLIHIQSFQHDTNFILAQMILTAFGKRIRVVDETHGFRRHEERGLDGFVDGTENPQSNDIANVAINEHGGSYILFQHYQHDITKWNQHSLAEQEEAVAREKISNEEFPKAQRHPRSHIARTNLREDGVKLKIVRRSLPYGQVSGVHGLAFVAYCARLHNLEVQLKHMFGDVEDGLTDLLLSRLSRAISGGYYYAPSVERLHDLGL